MIIWRELASWYLLFSNFCFLYLVQKTSLILRWELGFFLIFHWSFSRSSTLSKWCDFSRCTREDLALAVSCLVFNFHTQPGILGIILYASLQSIHFLAIKELISFTITVKMTPPPCHYHRLLCMFSVIFLFWVGC